MLVIQENNQQLSRFSVQPFNIERDSKIVAGPLTVHLKPDSSTDMSNDDYQKAIQDAYDQKVFNATITASNRSFGATQITSGPIGRYWNKNEDRILSVQLPSGISDGFNRLTSEEQKQMLTELFSRLDSEVTKMPDTDGKDDKDDAAEDDKDDKDDKDDRGYKANKYCGCTLSMVLVDPASVHCAYVGDSPAMVVRLNKKTGEYQYKVLTDILHHPSPDAKRPEERYLPPGYRPVQPTSSELNELKKSKISLAVASNASGARIFYNPNISVHRDFATGEVLVARLNNNLAMTRAIGDSAMEEYGKTALPGCNSLDWPPEEDTVDIVFLGSDGVTEDMTKESTWCRSPLTYDAIAQIIAQQTYQMYSDRVRTGQSNITAASMAEEIGRMATERSSDNISAMIQIHDPAELKEDRSAQLLLLADGHGGKEVADFVIQNAPSYYLQGLDVALHKSAQEDPVKACELESSFLKQVIQKKGKALQRAELYQLTKRIMSKYSKQTELENLLEWMLDKCQVKQREPLLEMAKLAIEAKEPNAFDCFVRKDKAETVWKAGDLLTLAECIAKKVEAKEINSIIAGQFFISLMADNTKRGILGFRKKPLAAEKDQKQFLEYAKRAQLDPQTLHYLVTKCGWTTASHSSDEVLNVLGLTEVDQKSSSSHDLKNNAEQEDAKENQQESKEAKRVQPRDMYERMTGDYITGEDILGPSQKREQKSIGSPLIHG